MEYYVNLITLFLVGIFQEILLTLNFRFVAKDKIIPAVISSFAIAIVSMLVLFNILNQLLEKRSFDIVVVYALGIAVGVALGMKKKII